MYSKIIPGWRYSDFFLGKRLRLAPLKLSEWSSRLIVKLTILKLIFIEFRTFFVFNSFAFNFSKICLIDKVVEDDLRQLLQKVSALMRLLFLL